MTTDYSQCPVTPLSEASATRLVARVSTDGAPQSSCGATAFLASEETRDLPPGFAAYLLPHRVDPGPLRNVFLFGDARADLRPGDVVRIDPSNRRLSWLYRSNQRSNAFLVTERCNSRCVMCPQPPRDADDGWLVDEIEQAIPLIPKDAGEIGITGGEPGLLGHRLSALVSLLRDHLPFTSVHILSNGRPFGGRQLAQLLAGVAHPDLMVGIPLYSDLPEDHDWIVQSRGAFDAAVRGILALKRNGIRVETRFVVHRETVSRMTALARFIARNLTFVDHVALMGLEHVGFAKANLDNLWIDPADYQQDLADAVRILDRAGIPVSIYNHPLCVLDERIREFAVKSISEWKREFVPECERCQQRSACGGFFASAVEKRGRGVHAL